MHDEHDHHQSMGDHQHDHDGEMREPGAMMLAHPTQERWPQYPIIILGLWLISSPFTLGYQSLAMTYNDIIVGVVLISLAGITLFARNGWANYANGFVGLWLLFAPIVFSAPTAAAYANDTLVGIMVITFSVLIVMRMEMSGPDVPPGWSYNPSSGAQRAPLIALGLVGFFFSFHMAAFQLGHIDFAWDPVFRRGTVEVLTSDVSKAFPVSDAGLGAVAYAVEVLMGFMGDKRRWRTMPWMVTFFGIVVIPLGFTQIVLIILQPVAVGAWCTLCLLSAFAMLWMIALTVDEVVAMGQFLARRTRHGDSLWYAFWMGGQLSEEDAGVPADELHEESYFGEPFWGVTLPWTLLVAMALGFWLMLSPTILGTQGLMADSSHLVGALVVSFAVIATGEPARFVRFVNVLLGAWVVVAPWLLAGGSSTAAWNGVFVGVLLILVSLPRGTIHDQYGGWEQYVAAYIPAQIRRPLNR